MTGVRNKADGTNPAKGTTTINGTNTTNWQAQRERGSPVLLRLLRWIALRLGHRTARLLLYPITAYFLVFAPSARAASRDYLGRILGRPARQREVFRHLFHFSAATLDRVFFLTGREQSLAIRTHGLTRVEAEILGKQGALLLSAHVGSFEALRTLTRRSPNLRLKILMEANQNPSITALLHELAPEMAEMVIPLGGIDSLLRVEQAVRNGAFVGIMADRRITGDRTVTTEFLGRPVHLPQGPLALAVLLEVPVILALGLYDGDGGYDLHFEILPEYRATSRAERPQQMAALARDYTRRLEHHLAGSPYNWFNFYDFWGPSEP